MRDIPHRQPIDTDCARRWADVAYEENSGLFWARSSRVRTATTIFCKIDHVLELFERLRLGRRRYVLLTGEGDLPCDAFRQGFLPANIAVWFATNVTHESSRVVPWPLGLGGAAESVTAKAPQIDPRPSHDPARTGWLYVNFRPDTNPAVRKPLYDHYLAMSGSEWVTFDPPRAHNDNDLYLSRLATHRFVLCPAGNGVDTHRAWEALQAGAFPVVQRSCAARVYDGLPVLIVDDLKDLSPEMLACAWPQLVACSRDKLAQNHWRSRLEHAASGVRARRLLSCSAFMWESLRYTSGMVQRRTRAAFAARN